MKKSFIVIYTILLSSLSLVAQQDLLIYNMPSIPQAMYVNPAQAPPSRVNIGLPGMSSILVHHQNTIFNPYHLFEANGNQMNFRTDHYLSQVRKNNYFGASAAIDLLSIGTVVGEKDYFSFAIREKFFSRINLPGDLLRFPFTGNASFDELEDGTLDFSGLSIGLSHYREYSLGWQRNVNEKWNVGARLKYLSGMENIDTKESNITWKTDEDTWDWELAGEMAVYSSGIWNLMDSIDDNSDLENGEISDYLLKRKNRGVGLDLGISYQVNEKLNVSASLIDLGFISWQTYNKNFVSTQGEFVYAGLDITDNVLYADSAMSDSLDVVLEDLLDDLEDTFAYTENEDKYKSSLLTRIHIGAEYELYKKEKSCGSAAFLFQSEIYKGVMKPTFTLSYNQRVQRWLSLSLAYSVADRNFRNLGFGFSVNGGPLQLYVLTDNLLSGVVTKMSFGDEADAGEESNVSYPSYGRNVQVHTGINLTFGRKAKDRDEDGVPDKKDDCPDTPGLEEFKGCPDSDLDGVPDKDDECPNTAGSKEMNGCPDTDGDGLADKVDQCPDQAGLEEFGGCPDSDGDKIADKDDACPNVAGIEAFKGCPDTDGDGIQDSEDRCIELAGTVEFEGCPDTDKDGLADPDDDCPEELGPQENKGCPWGDKDGDGLNDKEDKCPTSAGPIDNNGCPYDDLDGDSVIDKDDRCPNTPGPAENQGCPIIEKEEQEVLNTAFENLEFLSGKDIIKESSYASLEELAKLLLKKEDWKLQISGHTDNVGSESTNLALSKKRSKSVAAYIESRGVSPDRLITKWYGESQPIADNKTNEGRQRNRRVEMEVIFD